MGGGGHPPNVPQYHHQPQHHTSLFSTGGRQTLSYMPPMPQHHQVPPSRVVPQLRTQGSLTFQPGHDGGMMQQRPQTAIQHTYSLQGANAGIICTS